MAPPLYTTQTGRLWHAGQILIVTVGLPGRGKTHLAHAIQRYLRWIGVQCQVYNLANTRRELLGRIEKLPQDYFGELCHSETAQLRQKVTGQLESQIEDFFEHGGQVAVYDAYNSNQERRKAIQKRFEARHVQLMFIGTCVLLIAECQCDDEELIERNIRSMHTFNPDFEGWDLEQVFKHLRERISQHEILYEPITERSCPHIQLLNLGQHIVVNNVHGYLQNRIVLFLMNMHSRERIIYFARAGEALVEHLYKADADLSSLGVTYADRLCQLVMSLRQHPNKTASSDLSLSQEHSVSYIASNGEQMKPLQSVDISEHELQVWCSTRKRSEGTAAPFREQGVRVIEHSRLCEMNPGIVDGMSDEEILARFPHHREERDKDPYGFRFPRAESYHDLAIRLEPVIMELERVKKDVLIIAQSSVLRCLIAYLQGNKPHEIPFIQVREGDLVEIYPQAFGIATRVYSFWDPEKEREKRDSEFVRQAARQLAKRQVAASTSEASSSPDEPL
ncbi:hypothetical protein MCAP1_002407 [Malassezia caprae]|uniref:6-phosphofructo-2-kinase domain-containing protein n=1 Tax=Malassezia caprae TaxID=1381934 RepID=A0AAF0E9L4_9BASI|nr:hypothetical protein MCAP1_002407 [Malassezia caprae]